MLLEKMQTNQGGELINSKQVVARMSQKNCNIFAKFDFW